MKKHKYLLIIILISASVHFAFFGRPNETVFDEVHFGKFVSGYYTGEYYFDIHPPLGKLIIAGFAKLFNFSAPIEQDLASGGKPQYSFINIGDQFPDNKYLALRFLPALAGMLLPIIIYFFVLELGMSRITAFVGGLLVIFDNALLAQSRLMLLDSFLLLFGFASLLFYFKSCSTLHVSRYKILMALFAGLAISIKWTGLSFIVLPILIEIYSKVLKDRKFIAFTKFIFFFLISFLIYVTIFALHFALLPKSGPGDAFMKSNFREQGIIKNIWNLNKEMYRSNQRLGATHPYGSSWYTWPFMTRPIFYWVKDNSLINSERVARIYFFGNPVIWWTSTMAVLFSITYYILRITNKYRLDKTYMFLLSGYIINMLPFIGIKRVLFLYHYLAALIFAILIMVYLIDRFGELAASKTPLDWFGVRKSQQKIFTGLIIASTVAFLFFAPLSYGLPLSDKAYEARVWFAGWK